jgi:hypothetical protein
MPFITRVYYRRVCNSSILHAAVLEKRTGSHLVNNFPGVYHSTHITSLRISVVFIFETYNAGHRDPVRSTLVRIRVVSILNFGPHTGYTEGYLP